MQYLKYFREGQAIKNHAESAPALRRITEKLFFMEQFAGVRTASTTAVSFFLLLSSNSRCVWKRNERMSVIQLCSGESGVTRSGKLAASD
jgi:hypothetical protein